MTNRTLNTVFSSTNQIIEYISEKISIDTVKRTAFATLPFFSLYKPLNYPLGLGFGAIRILESISHQLNILKEGEATDNQKLCALINTSISIISLAGTIFAHPLGMCISTAHELIVELGELKEHLAQNDWEKASISLLKTLNHSFYLACITSGGLELSIASISAQILLGIYSAKDKFSKDHYIEGMGHLLMTLVKGRQLQGQMQTLQIKWKIKELQRQLPYKSINPTDEMAPTRQTRDVGNVNSPESLLPEEKDAIRLELKTLGFDLDKVTNAGDNVLLQAVRKNNVEATLLALRYGFDLSHQNKAGDTALHIAAGKGSFVMVKTLVEHGAPIHVKNKLDQLPFHKGFNFPEIKDYFISIGQQRTSFIEEYAIANNLRPDFIDNQGDTFIHRLIKKNEDDLLKQVFAEDYKLEQLKIENKKDFRPFDLVVAQKKDSMLDLFLHHFSDEYVSYGNLHQASRLGWKSGLEKLLPFFDKEILLRQSEGRATSQLTGGVRLPDGNTRTYFREAVWTPRPDKNLLHQAVYSGDLDTVKFLVEYGFSYNLSTRPDYIESTYETQRHYSDHQLDVLAELDHFGQYSSEQRLISPGGYANPVASPLVIAESIHPENNELLAYLNSLQAERTDHASKTGKSLNEFFHENDSFQRFDWSMNLSRKSYKLYKPLRAQGYYLICHESGEYTFLGDK